MAVASWCLASEKVHGLTLSGTGILKSFYEDDLLPFFLGSFNSFLFHPIMAKKGAFSPCVMSYSGGRKCSSLMLIQKTEGSYTEGGVQILYITLSSN